MEIRIQYKDGAEETVSTFDVDMHNGFMLLYNKCNSIEGGINWDVIKSFKVIEE